MMTKPYDNTSCTMPRKLKQYFRYKRLIHDVWEELYLDNDMEVMLNEFTKWYRVRDMRLKYMEKYYHGGDEPHLIVISEIDRKISILHKHIAYLRTQLYFTREVDINKSNEYTNIDQDVITEIEEKNNYNVKSSSMDQKITDISLDDFLFDFMKKDNDACELIYENINIENEMSRSIYDHPMYSLHTRLFPIVKSQNHFLDTLMRYSDTSNIGYISDDIELRLKESKFYESMKDFCNILDGYKDKYTVEYYNGYEMLTYKSHYEKIIIYRIYIVQFLLKLKVCHNEMIKRRSIKSSSITTICSTKDVDYDIIIKRCDIMLNMLSNISIKQFSIMKLPVLMIRKDVNIEDTFRIKIMDIIEHNMIVNKIKCDKRIYKKCYERISKLISNCKEIELKVLYMISLETLSWEDLYNCSYIDIEKFTQNISMKDVYVFIYKYKFYCVKGGDDIERDKDFELSLQMSLEVIHHKFSLS